MPLNIINLTSSPLRLAVLSDVHGNEPALEAVLAEIDRLNVVGILVTGDLTAGPSTRQTMRCLRERGAVMIRGNTDANLLRLAEGSQPPAWYRNKQFALARWNLQQLDAADLAFLGSLPPQRVVEFAGTPPILMVHGSPKSDTDGLDPGEDLAGIHNFMEEIEQPVLLCGHSHIPWVVHHKGRLAVNSGAVAGPLDGDPRASFALLTWEKDCWQAEIRRVDYDLAQIERDFVESGLLEEGGALARAFMLSTLKGKNVGLDFLDHAAQLARRAGYAESELPDDIWDLAEATFGWDW
jgi:predicted phosphodiesterase